MDKQLTVEIEGRKAIPVRAIPYITGWGAGELVQYFARKVGAPFEKLQDVFAYHMLSGQPFKYLPREWDDIQINLNSFEAELHDKFQNDDQGYAAWNKDAVAMLPEGVFVWLDEFEKDCIENLSLNRIIFPNERDGDRELNYTPHLTTAIREMVLAGFDASCTKSAKVKNLAAVTIKPWDIVDSSDPEPLQEWYTPARYFARELVKNDSTLLCKKSLLAEKVSHSLLNAGIFGRKKYKKLDGGTVMKAFSKVNLG